MGKSDPAWQVAFFCLAASIVFLVLWLTKKTTTGGGSVIVPSGLRNIELDFSGSLLPEQTCRSFSLLPSDRVLQINTIGWDVPDVYIARFRWTPQNDIAQASWASVTGMSYVDPTLSTITVKQGFDNNNGLFDNALGEKFGQSTSFTTNTAFFLTFVSDPTQIVPLVGGSIPSMTLCLLGGG